MPDKPLPDINNELNALPFPEEVKDQIYNAFYAVSDHDSKKIFESLPIPGKLKNDFYQKRYQSLYTTPKPPSPEQQQDSSWLPSWDKVKQNAPRSIVNAVKGPALSVPMGLERDWQTGINVGKDAAQAYKTGGPVAGLQAGAESLVKNAVVNPIFGMVEHLANRVMHPSQSLEEDPVGTVVDYATALIPAARAGSGAVRGARAATAAGESMIGGAFKGAKGAFKPKVAEQAAPAAEVVAEEPTVNVNDKSFMNPQPRGPIHDYINSKKTTRVEGTKPIFDKSKSPTYRKKNLLGSGPPPVVTEPPPGSVIKSPGFTNRPSGESVSTEPPPRPIAGLLPEAETAQVPQPPVGRQLPAPAENPAGIDLSSLSSEYKVSQDALHKFNQLDTATLEHVAHQADEMVKSMMAGEVIDPSGIAKAAESSRAARAILQQRSYYMEGTRSPLEYSTQSAPIPGNAPEITAHTADAKQAGSMPTTTTPKTAAPPSVQGKKNTPAKKPAPAPAPKAKAPAIQPAKAAVTPEVVKPPVVENAPAPPAKPVAAAPRKPAKAANPAKPAAPAPAPVVEEPIAPSVKVEAEAPKIEPVKSEIQTKLEDPKAEPAQAASKPSDMGGYTEAPIGKDGKASYRDATGLGATQMRKGERMFTRLDKQGYADRVTVYEQNGKVNVLDTEENTLGSYPAGTSAEDAISQYVNKSSKPQAAAASASAGATAAPTPKPTAEAAAAMEATPKPAKAEPAKPSAKAPDTSRGEELSKRIKAGKPNKTIEIGPEDSVDTNDKFATDSSHSFTVKRKSKASHEEYRAVKIGDGKYKIENDDGKVISIHEAKNPKDAINKAIGKD